MSSRSFWLRYWHRKQIADRARLYMLYNQLERPAAYAAAAHDIADQQKQERQARRQHRRAAGDTLLDTIWQALSRQDDERSSTTPHSEIGIANNPISGAVPAAAVRKRQPQPELAEGYPDGVFTGSVTGAQLIPDAEYHSSIHALDRSTHNWRRSISENARIEQERRAHWAARLAQMKAEGTA
jgi:hypothetical protein